MNDLKKGLFEVFFMKSATLSVFKTVNRITNLTEKIICLPFYQSDNFRTSEEKFVSIRKFVKNQT
jgi:hypothetical protein